MKRSLIVAVLGIFCLSNTTLMAQGNPEAGREKAVLCISCHGEGGVSTAPEIPKLAGQLDTYIVRATSEFQEGLRSNPLMSGIAPILSDPQNLEDIAAYFASQPVMSGTPGKNTEQVAQGQTLFASGRCNYCHGEGGRQMAPFKVVVPIIGGQHKIYLVKAMRDIRDGKRPGDPFDMMQQTLAEMTDADLSSIAEYLSGL